jgi:hypothetical protein
MAFRGARGASRRQPRENQLRPPGCSSCSRPARPREEYFTELADIRSSGRTMIDEDWIAVWARHDQYPA